MVFTPELFKYVLTQMLPEVIVHSESQDEEQVRGHYDRTYHHLLHLSLYLYTCSQVETTFTNGLSSLEYDGMIHILSSAGSWVPAWFTPQAS